MAKLVYMKDLTRQVAGTDKCQVETPPTPQVHHSENTTRDQTGKKGGKGGEPVAKSEGLAGTAKEMEVRLDQLGAQIHPGTRHEASTWEAQPVVHGKPCRCAF